MDKKNQKPTELEKIKPNLKGQDIIKFIAKTLPHQPGVYQMEDEEGQILYIGKAKNLAKRVISYTSLNNLTRRLQRMVSFCLLYTSPSPRDRTRSRMPSSA